ncbi:hypothetical protein PVAP13_6KG249400 [Panicum virgatum]|uniref:Uncharacterized protein n=1 Tax=Panicum virgatum TaxID=38727 RepID=A0A8T0RFI9_PANVG|nr:hypothetical protein PVAP13_6KG140690 [Panicum virgatum]KAG2583888.1 hypothetical protein PVAP13_6KG250918 [Panicum virgatum]KAG2583892.1 hypothetical protein PVAP13_6KG249400 [Panicum virgatum]
MDREQAGRGRVAPRAMDVDPPPAVGTKKKTPEGDDGGNHGYGGWAAGTTETAAGSSRSSRKRPYPYEVGEEDREIDKMFKCNYWEDPAREGTLQRFGQLFARAAAVDVYCESSRRIVAAWLAGRAHLKLDDKET